MKYVATILLFIVLSKMNTIAGQATSLINYQAVVRNSALQPMPNTEVSFRFTILGGATDGPIVYQETQNVETSPLGMVSLAIGEGATNDEFDDIHWASSDHYMKIELDIEGGTNFEELGIQRVKSVPQVSGKGIVGPLFLYSDISGQSLINMVGSDMDTLATVTMAYAVEPNFSSIDFDTRLPSENTGSSYMRFWKNSLDNGDKSVQFYKGGEPNEIEAQIGIGDDSYFNVSEGNLGIGTSDPLAKLHLGGNMRISSPSNQKIGIYNTGDATVDNRITSYDENEEVMWHLYLGDRNNDDRLVIDHPGDNCTDFYIIGTTEGPETHVRLLDIDGGCDIVESFNSMEQLMPGDVVVVDVKNEHAVCKSYKKYDSHVVGVISGANGVNSGLSLSQEGMLEGNNKVTLTGQVYVSVVGTVNAGDLLTTSEVPGKAMSVKRHRKAFGSVIGKALESDTDGDGLVLVLVNLQ